MGEGGEMDGGRCDAVQQKKKRGVHRCGGRWSLGGRLRAGQRHWPRCGAGRHAGTCASAPPAGVCRPSRPIGPCLGIWYTASAFCPILSVTHVSPCPGVHVVHCAPRRLVHRGARLHACASLLGRAYTCMHAHARSEMACRNPQPPGLLARGVRAHFASSTHSAESTCHRQRPALRIPPPFSPLRPRT